MTTKITLKTKIMTNTMNLSSLNTLNLLNPKKGFKNRSKPIIPRPNTRTTTVNTLTSPNTLRSTNHTLLRNLPPNRATNTATS